MKDYVQCPHCGTNVSTKEEVYDADEDLEIEHPDIYCDECGGEYDNHLPRCSESGSSFYLLITEGYD